MFLLVFIEFLYYNSNKMNINNKKMCELYDRECIGCLECEICDLNSDKICDNCGRCLDIRDDAVIKIDRIIIDED